MNAKAKAPDIGELDPNALIEALIEDPSKVAAIREELLLRLQQIFVGTEVETSISDLPLETMALTLNVEYESVRESMIRYDSAHHGGEKAPDLLGLPEVKRLLARVRAAKGGIVRGLVKANGKHFRLRYRGAGDMGVTILSRAEVDPARGTVFANVGTSGSAGAAIIKTIDIDSIQSVIWPGDAEDQQLVFNLAESKRVGIVQLATVLKQLYFVRKVWGVIAGSVDGYADHSNPGGIFQNADVSRYDELLRSIERTGIASVDKRIEDAYSAFRNQIMKKQRVLRNEREAIVARKGGPAIHAAPIVSLQEEIAGGTSYRMLRITDDSVAPELVSLSDFRDVAESRRDEYVPIPYFERQQEQETKKVPFVLTPWHLKIVREQISPLVNAPTTNTLLVGLAGTGKDYFIEWVCHLMNMENCSWVCHEIIDVNDVFFTVRIRDGSDHMTPTPVYRYATTPGCVANFSEFNKLGPKMGDINDLLDYKRQVQIPMEGRTLKVPSGNLFFASINPSWFGGGRERLPFDVKDRFQNVVQYGYPPFFPHEESGDFMTLACSKGASKKLASDEIRQKFPVSEVLYHSYEAEIRYRLFPTLETLPQLEFRKLWEGLFTPEYRESDEAATFGSLSPEARSVIVLKNVLKFAATYRWAFRLAKTGGINLRVSEMLTQRGVEAIIGRIVRTDPSCANLETYKSVLESYLIGRMEDPSPSDREVIRMLLSD